MFSRNLFSARNLQIKEALRKDYGLSMPLYNSYLRQSQVIQNNVSQYKFGLVSQQNNFSLPDQFLKVTDGFYAYALGFFLMKEVDADTGTGVLQTYPNATVFGAQAGDLEVFYNGSYSIQINQTVVVQDAPMKMHRVANTTLQSASNTLSESHVDDGFVELEPNLKLAGTQKIEIAVNIPTFSGIDIESGVGGTSYKLVCMPLGFSLPNGSSIFTDFYKRGISNN